MSLDIRMPNINATTAEGQLSQIRSYLYQFAEQLSWALNTVEGELKTQATYTTDSSVYSSAKDEAEKDKWTQFDELKELIIKSADIVEAYYTQIEKLIETSGKYVAKSQFGTYLEESSQEIFKNYDSIDAYYKNLQTVIDAVGGEVMQETNAKIIIGKVGEYTTENNATVPIYGLQAGQITTDSDGMEIFNRLAQYSTLGVELYENVGDTVPTAVFGLHNMKTTNAEIKGTLIHGGYEISSTNGIVYKWIGRS